MSEKYLGEVSTPLLINQIKENCAQKRTTLPIASIDELGHIYQYMGATSGSLVHGYFYECVSDGQDPATYTWQQVNIQPTAGTPTASGTTFNNTTSGLQATNVQGAIDEVESRVDTTESDIDGIEGKIPSTATTTNKLVDHDSLGTAAFKDSTDRVSPNNTSLVESQSVYSAINTALSSIYTPRGDIACAELTSDLLIAANVGNIYETSDSGTTSALFLQGAGVPIPTGSNVGIINAGQGRILFNLMANAFDLTGYQKKDLTQAVEGQTTVEGALGALSTNKISKVSGATNGDIATLDANGNLVDSGASIKNGGTKVLALKGNDNIHPADLNDLTEAGVYSIISQGSSHLPNDAFTWWQIIVITKSNTSANQGYCTQYAMARNNLVYMRDCEAGTWSSWEKLVTESDLNGTLLSASNTFTPSSGYEILDWSVYQLGNHVWGTFILHKTSGDIPAVQTEVGNFSSTLRNAVNSVCFCSNNRYGGGAFYTGYLFIDQTGKMLMGNPSGTTTGINHAKISIDFCLA